MTSFEKVNKVWCDLEEAYVKRNNGLSRMDFLKKILMYDSGEAAIRNLGKKVSDDRGDECRLQLWSFPDSWYG